MLKKERILKIVEIVNDKGFVTINDLMSQLNSSRSSIVRDVIELEENGHLLRERGGASKLGINTFLDAYNEGSVSDKELINYSKKNEIAKQASQIVKKGDCIFIDSGSTTALMIPYLVNLDITIVTTSIHFIKRLPANYKFNVYLIGGEYNYKYDVTSGNLIFNSLNKFRFKYSFLSATGLSIENNEVYITDSNIGNIKNIVRQKSDYSFLLVDDTKYHIKSTFVWANLESFDKIFTNKELY